MELSFFQTYFVVNVVVVYLYARTRARDALKNHRLTYFILYCFEIQVL